MVQYIISTSKYKDIFIKYIQDTNQYPLDLKNKWKEEFRGEIHWFKFEGTKREKEVLRERLATVISNIVQSCILTKFAKEYLAKRIDLTVKEKREVESMFILNNYVAKEEGVSYISYYLLYTPILRALEEQKILNIDGWMLFRTKQYRIILKDILEQTIYDYQTQKDYLRFVGLLRESTKLQESLEETLHLINQENKTMKIFNTDKQDVTDEYRLRYCDELIHEIGVTEEDIIMNIFMSVCPRNVIIHNKEKYTNVQFIETLEMVFEGHVEYCKGCNYCLEKENMSSE